MNDEEKLKSRVSPHEYDLWQTEVGSGVKHDSGKPPLDLLPTKGLIEIAKVMGEGKKKYGAQNWRNGMAWSRLVGAILRHVTAFNDGEDKDPETGLSHLAHAGCGILFLLEYISTHPTLDDRYKKEIK